RSVETGRRRAGHRAGAGIALLRAHRGGHGRPDTDGAPRRAGAGAYQRVRGHGCGRGAFRLCPAAQGPVAGWRAAVRNARTADGTAPAAGPLGSSGSSLHAKTFSVDRQSVFVGSFNFDPRSINLNTELGFVVDSPVLAAQMADLFDQDVARHAYRVELEPDGSLYWIEEKDGVQHRHGPEPGTVWWQRWLIWFLSLLPIEPLL